MLLWENDSNIQDFLIMTHHTLSTTQQHTPPFRRSLTMFDDLHGGYRGWGILRGEDGGEEDEESSSYEEVCIVEQHRERERESSSLLYLFIVF